MTVTAEFAAGASAQWYLQTKYGAMFWTATQQFRGARYLPSLSPVGGPALAGLPPWYIR